MSDSDSSDEDVAEKMRLSEAVVDVIPNTMNTKLTVVSNKTKDMTDENTPSKVKADKRKTIKPSLRPCTDDKDFEHTVFTPGVQKFVASKLCEEIDRNIEMMNGGKVNGTNIGMGDSGIKLFSSSEVKLVTDTDPTDTSSVLKQKKRTYSSSSDSSEENERLAEAAVSHDFIMVQSRLNFDSDKDEKDTGSTTGELTQSKNKKDFSVLEDSNSSDKRCEDEKSRKKKKKKKKCKEEIKIS